MRFKLRSLWLSVIFAAAQACTNVGFVDSAKAAANDEFGIDVFYSPNSLVAMSSMLASLQPSLASDCTSLSGLEKANCICASNARQLSLKGTYRAWLSLSSTADAICNIQGLVSTACSVSPNLGPFFTRQNGFRILAEDYAELSTSGFRVPLETELISAPLLTGTNLAGRATGNDCASFQSIQNTDFITAGDRIKGGISFTADKTIACNTDPIGTLLCMRQPK